MAKKNIEKKKHHDVGRIFTKIVAAILALIMIGATAATIVYYIAYAA